MKNEATSKLTHISDTKYRISLEVPSDIVDETFKFFYNQARAKSTVKGFRPGKAPLNMISKIYQQEVRYNVFDHLANKFVNRTMESHQLRLIKQLNTQIKQFSEGAPLKFFVELEAKKEIVVENFNNLLRSIDNLPVTKEMFEMSKVDEMLEGEINKQKEILSTRTPINEVRKIKHGEYSIIDCKCFHNDKLIASLDSLVFMAFNIDLATSMGITKDFLDEIKKDIGDDTKKTILMPSFLTVDKMIGSFFDEYFNEALKHNLIDMEPGQTKKIPVIYPSDHIAHSKTPLILQVHLKQFFNTSSPPKVNDTFAKKIGFSSVQDMNEKLKQKYTELEKKRIEEKLEIDILKELLKQNPINIPEEYILIQKKHFTQGAKRQLLKRYGETQSYMVDKQIEEWEKQGRFRNDAIYSISEGILIQKLAKAWHLFEPIEKEFKRNLETNKQFSEVANRFKVNNSPFKGIDKKDIMNPIFFEMIKRAVVQHIISKANIKES